MPARRRCTIKSTTPSTAVAVLCGAALVAAAFAAPVRADVRAGVQAYGKGDYETALREFAKPAEDGDPRAQYNLAIMYLKGQGVEKDIATGVKWQKRAAEQGLASAQHGLGVMYYRAIGVTRDYAGAAKWFRKAARQGYRASQLNLGVMHFTGLGVAKDDAEVVKWIVLAAAKGLAEAQYRLGRMYERGSIFRPSPDDARFWYGLAAKGGHKGAQANLLAVAPAGGEPAAVPETGKAVSDAGDIRAPAAVAPPRAAIAGTARARAERDAPVAISPAPRPAAPRAPTLALAAGWRVQLASFRSEREASAAWIRLKRTHGDLLGALVSNISRVDLGAKRGIYHRLKVGPLASREAAHALCKTLRSRARRQGCIPLAPARSGE